MESKKYDNNKRAAETMTTKNWLKWRDAVWFVVAGWAVTPRQRPRDARPDAGAVTWRIGVRDALRCRENHGFCYVSPAAGAG